MSESYNYSDELNLYVDPENKLLRNIPKLTSQEDLIFFESTAVIKRLQLLFLNPIYVKSFDEVLGIHHFLFQDVYEWAGELRKVEINKSGKQFLPIISFETGIKFINSLIREIQIVEASDVTSIVYLLAQILDNINYMHPFREGNGRTQREVVRVIALSKGYKLSLNPPDNLSVYNQYMQGTICSDIGLLAKLISQQISPI